MMTSCLVAGKEAACAGKYANAFEEAATPRSTQASASRSAIIVCRSAGGCVPPKRASGDRSKASADLDLSRNCSAMSASAEGKRVPRRCDRSDEYENGPRPLSGAASCVDVVPENVEALGDGAAPSFCVGSRRMRRGGGRFATFVKRRSRGSAEAARSVADRHSASSSNTDPFRPFKACVRAWCSTNGTGPESSEQPAASRFKASTTLAVKGLLFVTAASDKARMRCSETRCAGAAEGSCLFTAQ
mmetsp:Transcript_13235/g.44241  ORF Transcript_13235/g.44241 Transcript_13235/m.44241 type:complete len:245 (-) Transcript_13235:1364-2098(-)